MFNAECKVGNFNVECGVWSFYPEVLSVEFVAFNIYIVAVSEVQQSAMCRDI